MKRGREICGGRRYRYYVSSRLIEKGSDVPTGWRLPTLEIEGAVLTALAAWLRSPQELMAVIGNHNLAAPHLNQSLNTARQRADSIQHSTYTERRALIAMLVSRITISSGTLVLQIRRSKLLQAMGVAHGQAVSTDATNEEQTSSSPSPCAGAVSRQG
ncbi:hypothetical protein [Aestuariivirga sp.]|uniref:hypothetical protein n=1 Tax=Aestuariivirga sp. TaxID=2650926 RepID=UPI0035934ADF